jgi:DNA replication and repair protein RecF
MLPFKIEKLQVTNFRNLEDQIISFSPNINCIFGDNGNGKTNILEAIYFLILRKSFRKNASFPQILSMDGEKPEILFSSVFKSEIEEELLSLSGKLSSEGGSWYQNGKGTNRKLKTGVVFFNTFFFQGFHNSPSSRRSWVDDHLGQLDSAYKSDLARYQKSLRFRNKLLSKKPSQFRKQIEAIDKEMAPLSYSLTNSRLSFLEELKPFVQKAFFDLFSEDHNLEITLDTKMTLQNPEIYFDLAKKNQEKDEILGYTHYGVHKDDYVLLFDGLNSFDYCSLGQQKMSYLSLLFAYIELFRYKFKSFPIVLLDDVSGELDKLRWKRLVDYLKTKNFQILITTANDRFKDELDTIAGAKKILVDGGSIQTF